MTLLSNRILALFLLTTMLAVPDAAMAKRHMLKVEIDGIERRALMYAPENAGSEPLPLILVFHGRGDSYDKFAAAVKLHRDWPEAIVVYPQGRTIATAPPMRGWQHRLGTYDDRDLKLTDWLLAEVGRRYATAPQSTYVAGFSNGGHFTLLLMAERSAVFAAFMVIGSVQPEYTAASPPKPLLYLFGSYEHPQFQDDWVKTVQALARHNRSSSKQTEYLACCQLLHPKPGGAALAYGRYNAGHIWPHRGNEWLLEFFTKPLTVEHIGK
jgi:polyhydroxybutyrate depolymerase